MVERHFLIGNMATWHYANEVHLFDKESVIFTEAPYLYENLIRENRKVRSPSLEISENDRGRSADLAIDYALFLKRQLNLSAYSGEDKIHWGDVLNLSLAYFVNTVLMRAMELEYALSKSETLTIPYLAADVQNLLSSSAMELCFFRCNYYALIVQFMQELGSAAAYEKVVLVALPKSFADYQSIGKDACERVSYLERLCLRGLSILSGDVNVLERLVFRRLRKSGSIGWGAQGETWFVLSDNRMISSLILPLLLTGRRLKYLSPECDGVQRTTPCNQSSSLRLAEATEEWAVKNELSEIKRAAMGLIVRRVNDYLIRLRLANKYIGLSAREAADSVSKGKGVLLSGSAHDHHCALYFENLCDSNLRTIGFTDGAVGLNRCDRVIEQFPDKKLCHGYVTHNRYDEDFYRQLHSDHRQPIYNYSHFKHIRPHWPSISRSLGRMLLGQPIGKRLVIYAPTRFRADHRSVKGDLGDICYWLFMRQVVLGVLNGLDANVFIKTYGKEVYPGQMRRNVGETGHPLSLLSLGDNVTVRPYPRLNYIMHAADVLIIDRATSTIQSAMSIDKPLIFINNRSHPVDDDVLNVLDKSVFLVDAHRDNWEECLRNLLSLPRAELDAQWEAKHVERENFKKYYVFGEDGSRNHLIQWIKRTALSS